MESKFVKSMRRNLKGFTLTEILVAISVFLLIVVIIYSVQAFSQSAYQRGEIATEIFQNGRVILEKMSREIRQAKDIVTSLPEIPDDPDFPPPAEILFQDGHTLAIIESGYAQGGEADKITLIPTASSENNFYKGAFIKIIAGTGVGQIRKIASYDGQTKVASVEENWETTPLIGDSEYRIDSSYYYIKYWKDEEGFVNKQIVGYCPPEECDNFVFSPWNATNELGQTLYELDSKIILEDVVIGEYVNELGFSGLKIIHISLDLQKGAEETKLETKIFGRNL